jgi:hypothetical protein
MTKEDKHLCLALAVCAVVCLMILTLISEPWWAAPLGALMGSSIVPVLSAVYYFLKRR